MRALRQRPQPQPTQDLTTTLAQVCVAFDQLRALVLGACPAGVACDELVATVRNVRCQMLDLIREYSQEDA